MPLRTRAAPPPSATKRGSPSVVLRIQEHRFSFGYGSRRFKPRRRYKRKNPRRDLLFSRARRLSAEANATSRRRVLRIRELRFSFGHSKSPCSKLAVGAKRQPLYQEGLSFWSYWPDLNRRPADYESAALPTEPQ